MLYLTSRNTTNSQNILNLPRCLLQSQIVSMRNNRNTHGTSWREKGRLLIALRTRKENTQCSEMMHAKLENETHKAAKTIHLKIRIQKSQRWRI